MRAKLTVKQRLSLIKRFLNKNEEATRLAREAGISRVLFYRWLKRYKENNLKISSLKPLFHNAKIPRKLLSPKERLATIEKKLTGKPVAEICQEYGISRTIFYRWKNRYEQAPLGEKTGALWDKIPKREKYYHQTPRLVEKTILTLVIKYPELSTHKIVACLPQINGKPILGNHGVQNILRRFNLSYYCQRLAYAKTHTSNSLVQLATANINRIRTVFEAFMPSLAPAPPPNFKNIFKSFFFGFGFSAPISYLLLAWLRIYSQVPQENKLGLIFASIALFSGSVFFLYSLKYYLTLAIVLGFSRHIGQEGENQESGTRKRSWLMRFLFRFVGLDSASGLRKGYVGGLQPNLEGVILQRSPFVSIHLPMYNEKKVVNRLLSACTSMDYQNYEVIVIDDSNDETTSILADWKNHPKVKLIHRESREGYKGGALKEAMKITDPRTEFVLVFDSDFVPYPDTITQFLKYFQAVCGTLNFDIRNQEFSHQGRNQNSPVAAIQGYQWHVLNKSENWITRGVRSEYAGSYVVERSGAEVYGGLKQIAGSVYMIRMDVLKKLGWLTSITEDFQLTLRLYEQGYKVIYTPYIQGPAECVSTIKRLVRQRMRWAEGHSFNVRKMFGKLLGSSNLTYMEKLEFLFMSPYYLQATFFLLGTFCWFVSEAIFKARLPFWTALWGWSLVLTNMFSLPLVNTVGLFLEESEEKDYLGILSFVVLSYLLVPFQAYASVKGFIEKEEGPWFRTPKTGMITDVLQRGRFYRWISGILPGFKPSLSMEHEALSTQELKTNSQLPYLISSSNPYLALKTANNRFGHFTIRRRKIRWLAKTTLAVLLILSMNLSWLSFKVPLALASPGTQIKTIEMPIYQYASATDITATQGIDAGTYSSSNGPQFSLDIPETMVDCLTGTTGTNPCHAYVEWRFILSANNVTAGEMKFRRGTNSFITQSLTTINTNSGESQPFIIRMDVTSEVAQGNNTYNFNAYVNQTHNTDSAKLIVTYEYDDTVTTQVKTVRYALQTKNSQSSSGSTDTLTSTLNPNLQEANITIQKAWVEYVGQVSAGTTDAQIRGEINNNQPITNPKILPVGGASAVFTFIDGANKTTMDFVAMYEPVGVVADGAALGQLNYKASNTIISYNNAQVMNLKGGELLITYTYSYYNQTSTTHRNTAKYHVGQLSGALPITYTQIGAPAVYLPESSLSNYNAYLKIVGTNTAAANTRYRVTITGGTAVEYPSASTYYATVVTQQAGRNVIFIDISSNFSTNWQTGDTVTVEALGDKINETYAVGAELIVSYNFVIPTSGTYTGIKTVNWFVGQETAKSTSDPSFTFNTYIPESSTTKRSSGAEGNFEIFYTSATYAFVQVADTVGYGPLNQTTGENLSVSTFQDASNLAASSGTGLSGNIRAYYMNIDLPVNVDKLGGLTAFITYEVTAPAAPEKALLFIPMAIFLPKVIEWWQKRRLQIHLAVIKINGKLL
ncbi:MAG: glycosyltransferase [Patescibacteria group bacterium]|nr:glycosyltransferase [Patescibacteria group bacterium]MCL5095695.1 glycosyltransferase [Patescibacteria group bacterium]